MSRTLSYVSATRVLVAGALAFATAAAVGGLPTALADGGKLGGALDKPYTVTIAKVAAKKGQAATAEVVIKPGKGYHMNLEFPTGLTLKPPAGVTAAKTTFARADAKLTADQGSFQVTLTSSDTGAKTVPGEVRFAVCTETTCDPQRSSISIEMDVK